MHAGIGLGLLAVLLTCSGLVVIVAIASACVVSNTDRAAKERRRSSFVNVTSSSPTALHTNQTELLTARYSSMERTVLTTEEVSVINRPDCLAIQSVLQMVHQHLGPVFDRNICVCVSLSCLLISTLKSKIEVFGLCLKPANLYFGLS